MSTVSLRPNTTHHLRGKYTHTEKQSIFNLILFKFTWSISTYPTNLYLKYRRELLSMQHLNTWQEFLCIDSIESENINIFDIPINDAISYINNNMFNIIDNNQVSQRKLEFFMRQFGDPNNKKYKCVAELLFVTEISQIKSRIINIIKQIYPLSNYTNTNPWGLIIQIPNGLPQSMLLNTHLNNTHQSICIDNIYDILARIYIKYINYDTATVPIYDCISTVKLDVIYELLTMEFPQTMCLTDPLTNDEMSIDPLTNDRLIDNDIQLQEIKTITTNDDLLQLNDTQFNNIIKNFDFNIDFNSNNLFGNIQIFNNNQPLNDDELNNQNELHNIYKLITTYDDILNDCAIKIQNCYDEYKNEIIS
eukprot:270588_1